MKYKVISGFHHYTYGLLDGHCEKITHFTSTKTGGFSLAPFGKMNISENVGDERSLVQKNKLLIANAFSIESDQLFFAQQQHEANIAIIDEQTLKLSADERANYLQNTDGMITDLKSQMLCVLTADCGGILLFDPGLGVVAAVHAGWRGTLKMIVAKALGIMKDKYGSNPCDIYAVVSPCIGVEAYEVGDEVASFFEAEYQDTDGIVDYSYEKAHINVAEANRRQMIDFGISEKQIEISNLCTYQNNDKFYSARRGDRGRFCSGIMLN